MALFLDKRKSTKKKQNQASNPLAASIPLLGLVMIANVMRGRGGLGSRTTKKVKRAKIIDDIGVLVELNCVTV